MRQWATILTVLAMVLVLAIGSIPAWAGVECPNGPTGCTLANIWPFYGLGGAPLDETRLGVAGKSWHVYEFRVTCTDGLNPPVVPTRIQIQQNTTPVWNFDPLTSPPDEQFGKIDGTGLTISVGANVRFYATCPPGKNVVGRVMADLF